MDVFFGAHAEARLLKSEEAPLRLQLNYGVHREVIEIRLVQVKDTYSAPMLGLTKGSRENLDSASDSDETVHDEDTRAVPKEEGMCKLQDCSKGKGGGKLRPPPPRPPHPHTHKKFGGGGGGGGGGTIGLSRAVFPFCS